MREKRGEERRTEERRGESRKAGKEMNRLLGKDNRVSIWMEKHWPHAQD